ncbi:unnamed protein product [Cercospora beticola]|nr:unnamed protein product [Cercospora beticola]
MSPTEEELEDDRQFFPTGWHDEDERIDLYALFVLEDVPVAELEDVLRRSADGNDGCQSLWLAGDYNTLPDFYFYVVPSPEGTKPPLDPDWQSPFRGQTAADAARFLRTVPKPRKPLCKTYFAILSRTLYEEQGHLLVCKVLEDGQVQSIPCPVADVGIYFGGGDRDHWRFDLRSWEEDGSTLL